MKQRYQNKKKGETQHTHTQNGMCGIQGLNRQNVFSTHTNHIFYTSPNPTHHSKLYILRDT